MSPTFNQSTKSDYKQSVHVATTADITLSGLQTIDGVALAANERVLVKDQAAPAENGVYTAQASGWSRSSDADGNTEVSSGLEVFVSEGAVHGDQLWVLTTDDPIVLNTTALTFDNVEDIVATGLGGSFVTLATSQAITGAKTFTAVQTFNDDVFIGELYLDADNGQIISTGVNGGFVATALTTTLANWLRVKKFTDADYRYQVNGAGKTEWGDGTSTPDTNLYRNSAGLLKTDSYLTVVGGLTVEGDVVNARLGMVSDDFTLGSDEWLRGRISGEGFARTIVRADGKIEWGDGTVAPDTDLYRSAPSTLRTTDSFVVDTNLTVSGNSAIGSASTDTLAFHGAFPVAQQATPVTLADVIAVLQALGLVA